ncbi:MAG: helicase [Bacteroidetes bacterium GWA2_32_17]|nr:MAG: helicase [Bacteroidetes bacterium GWA2_32_17]
MSEYINQQLKLAYEFVENTNKSVFLTGKAGTGKTTFLHELKKSSPKRMIIVAPTGVAAINATGVTIHSFFQLPFSPYIPNNNESIVNQSFNQRKFNRDKIRIIKSLELLVIDEISMVRADMLDAIDNVLKTYKDHSKPFGGVQLLLIGDLHQLAPVIKEDEWSILKNYYDTVFFFSSKALQQINFVSIELQHIYRQSDKEFIEILNKIRDNKIDSDLLKALNKRYIPSFNPNDDEGYIILTTHNANAHNTNQNKLKEIKEKSKIFKAQIKNDFPEYVYPTDTNLELKTNSQVMFVKNDSSHNKLYYNGKIGKITRFSDDGIYVKCQTDEREILVGTEEWENVKYSYNDKTKEIKEDIIGSFTQYPLKLAWAITIHKSQGLTFEKAIIDANASFAHGQVYVALSRCKNFEGLVLSTPITFSSVRMDNTILHFTQDVRNNEPDDDKLLKSKIQYQQDILLELIDFIKIKISFLYLKKILLQNSNIINKSVISDFEKIEPVLQNEIHNVSDKFKVQLSQMFTNNDLPEFNLNVQERIKKGAIYFIEKLNNLYEFIQNQNIEIDNKEVRKNIYSILEKLQKEIFIKLACLRVCINGFNTLNYIKTKNDSDVDFKPILKSKTVIQNLISDDSKHSALYAELKNWRSMLAEENDTDEYMILPYKAMTELTKYLPTTLAELRTIKGIGNKKIQQFGSDIIEIISSYCERNNTEKPEIEIKIKQLAKDKINSKLLSFDLYKSGKTIDEIASERKMVRTTIEGHLSYYIGTGELSIFEFLTNDKVDIITECFNKLHTKSLTEIYSALKGKYDYGELRLVLKHLEHIAEI